MTEDRRRHPQWISADGQAMRRLEMHLTYSCPQRCWFCSEEQRMQRFRSYPVTWARIAVTLKRHRRRGITHVHLTGGEPTLHRRFVDTLALARQLGLRTSIGTNGQLLDRQELARAAWPLLDEAMFSLHGPNRAVHDAQTGTVGSFDRVCRAIGLSQKLHPSLRCFVNTVVTRTNIDYLGDTVRLAESLGAEMVVVSNPTPEGGALQRYNELAVPFAELAAKLPAAVTAARRIVVRFFGVPLCLLGEHTVLSNDLHWDPRATVEWSHHPGKVVYGAVYNWEPSRRRVFVQPCQDCSWTGLCAGVFDTAAEKWPTDALKPLSRPLAKP